MNYSFVVYFAGSVRGDDFLTVHGLRKIRLEALGSGFRLNLEPSA